MLLNIKFNIFLTPYKRLLLSMFSKSTSPRESNIFLLRPKLFTIPRPSLPNLVHMLLEVLLELLIVVKLLEVNSLEVKSLEVRLLEEVILLEVLLEESELLNMLLTLLAKLVVMLLTLWAQSVLHT